VFAAPHDLTRLPDLFSIGIGFGMVAGGIAGFCWPGSKDDADLVERMVSGATLGSLAGAVAVIVIWLVAEAAGA
jgi:hypothetical protein